MVDPRLKSLLPRVCVPLALAAAPCLAHPQMHRVEAPTRVTRAIGVYEWTGDLAKPTAARFVPVSLFIDGHLQDAGLYMARPVPFALQTGDVYALEHAGEPEGLFDLDYAQHVVSGQALQDDDPAGTWYGFGKFTPASTPATPSLRPSGHLPVIQANGAPPAAGEAKDNTSAGKKDNPAAKDGDTAPHMSRRDASSASVSDPGTGGQNKGSNTSGGSTPASDDDTDRPTLRHRDPSQDASRRREYGSKSKQASVTAVGPAPGDDPDRPVLGRSSPEDTGTPPLTGLPAGLQQAVAVSDAAHRDGHNFARPWDTPSERTEILAALDALARPRVARYLAENRLQPSSGALPTAAGGTVTTSASAANAATAKSNSPAAPSPAQAADPADTAAPPRLQRGIPSQYRAPAQTASSQTASSQAATDQTANSQASSNTSAAAPKPAAHVLPSPSAATAVSARPASQRPGAPVRPRQVAGKTAPLTLQQQELTGYSLTYGGLPTFVYTAAASVSSLPASAETGAPGRSSAVVAHPASPSPVSTSPSPTHPGTAMPAAVYVTLVAQRLPSGELQVALSNVTDSLHLDRGPRLRLVDAVDPDDSHRASLLFELRGAASRQFALYRFISAEAEQTFSTASIE